MARYNAADTVAAWSMNKSARDAVGMAEAGLTADPRAASSDAAEGDAFADDLKPGTRLLQGQYTIEGFLNSGGFGITYLATDSLDRRVVIKECFPSTLCRRSGTIVRARSRGHQGEFRSVVRLFVEEARSLSRLAHSGIVGVHQVFEDNDTAYMAMDFIDGSDLLDILADHDTPFTPDQVVGLLKDILKAVEFVHASGMLHRDISPDNILVDRSGKPFLIDFGAAREQAVRASRVLSHRRVVKDGYSPQEFYLSGATQDASSDLYALAATFYHVITGDAPPESQRRLAAIAEGREDPYRPLAGRIDGYPAGFLGAIDTAARVLPKDRIRSAADWRARITGSDPAPARPIPAMPAPTHPSASQTMLARARRAVTTRLSTTPALLSASAKTAPARMSVIVGGSAVVMLAIGASFWT